MDIFESLENLPVSEECFDDIVSIVEDIIKNTKKKAEEAVKKYEDEHNTDNAIGADKASGLYKQACKNKNWEVLSTLQREANKKYFDLRKEGKGRPYRDIYLELQDQMRDKRGRDYKVWAPN